MTNPHLDIGTFSTIFNDMYFLRILTQTWIKQLI